MGEHVDHWKCEQLPLFDGRPFLIRKLVEVRPIDDGFDDVLGAPLSESFEGAVIPFPLEEEPPDLVA